MSSAAAKSSSRSQPGRRRASSQEIPTGPEGGSDNSTRVWGQTTRKVNLGDYSSVEISVGASVPAVGATEEDRQALYKELLAEQKKVIAKQARRLKKEWS